MKHYAGLDVSLRETSICVIDERRKIIREAKVVSEPETIAASLDETSIELEAVEIESGRRSPRRRETGRGEKWRRFDPRSSPSAS